MRLATFRLHEDAAHVRRVGLVLGRDQHLRIHPFPVGTDLVELLADTLEGRETRAEHAAAGDGLPLPDLELLPPVYPVAMRDFLTFEAHVDGMERGMGNPGPPDEWYVAPVFLFMAPHAVTGAHADVEMPPDTERMDFELEIAAVICRDVRNVTVADAGAAIGGYCVMNDWSARDVQGREMRLKLGPSKGKDFATTIGPWVVTPDELEPYRDEDGFLDLEMTVSVNGVQVGADRSGHMGWSFEQLVSHASRASWVKAGEVLASGTCASGALAESWGRTGSLTPPPLQVGDVVQMTIERIGTITNTVVVAVGTVDAVPLRAAGSTRPSDVGPSADHPTITTVDPATGRDLATYESDGEARVEAVLAAAHAAYGVWSARPLGERTDLLRSVGKLLAERREEYAALITAEMGKPLAEALGEVDKCAWNCEIVADSAAGWLADHEVASAAARSWLSYEPLGVVFAVMPWNYPFWQVLRFACAALVAGNAGVLKHSPNVTGCALAIERLLTDAGAPDGLFGVVVLADAQLAEATPRIIGDPRIAAVTLTGSERAGEAVGAAAGRFLKKSVLELGGSDPLVVLDDADLVAAADAAAKSRFGNGGQSCIAAKRFIVADAVADEFVALLVERVGALVVGDPTVAGTTVGPMARADLRDGLHDQVLAAIGEGAVLVTGGEPIDAPGNFYAPTVLDHVEPRMTTFDQETFGPVASVIRARDDDHAVELANDTDYGLAAAVWSRSERGLAVGRRIRSGALFVNAMVASDPRLPFGGIGRSGYGRELSAEGTREFTNVRTVFVGHS